jgi:hypothetical protein
MILPRKMFLKHYNEFKFMYHDDSEVLSSDFPGLRTSAASMIFTASMSFTDSFHQKIPILMV